MSDINQYVFYSYAAEPIATTTDITTTSSSRGKFLAQMSLISFSLFCPQCIASSVTLQNLIPYAPLAIHYETM